ncbi:MAG: exopolysaccharide Pel transporter PelG [bacterium]
MAGIGFELKKIFEKDTYIDTFRGVFYSTSIAGGPIFFSILSLVLLGIFSTSFLARKDLEIFLVTLVYIFAFSLISTGVGQLLITRYLSDLIYEKKLDQILPTFTTVLATTIVLQTIIGLPFFLTWEFDFLYKLTALMLFIAVGCTWQLMIFLSAVKNYRIVLWAFLAGLMLGFGLAMVLGARFGLPGFLHGFAIGQIVLLFVLLSRVFIEFRRSEKPSFGIGDYIKKMPQLIFIGFCYNAGIWVDKIIFWFSPHGKQVESFLYAQPEYDTATFFAFITVIPSYTYFLVKAETDFYAHFRTFFDSILQKDTLRLIHAHKISMAQSVKESLIGLLKLQGTVTLLCLFFSDEIAALFHLPPLTAIILEKAFLAVCLQMLLLTVMIFMMYFDIRRQLVVVAGLFLCANIVLTLVTLNMKYVYFGYGYVFACLLALLVGYFLLNSHFRKLEYRTFVSQPL